jgi:hypothetical protein
MDGVPSAADTKLGEPPRLMESVDGPCAIMRSGVGTFKVKDDR